MQRTKEENKKGFLQDMKTRVEQIGFFLKLRLVSIFALVILFASLMPLFVMAFYNFPSADDYGYAIQTYAIYEQTGSLWKVIIQAVENTISSWHTWQGTFATMFFMNLAPQIFGDWQYTLVPFVMIFFMIGGLFTICKSYFQTEHGASIWAWLPVACWLSFFCVQTLPSPVNGFFWFNGSLHYTIPFSVSLILLSFVMMAIKSGNHKIKRIFITLSCFFAVFCGGANYITALNTTLALGLLAAVYFCKKEAAWKWVLWPLGFQIAAFLINILAPGNAERQTHFGNPSAVWAIYESLRHVPLYVKEWLTPSLLVALLLLVPFLWKMAYQSKAAFKFPLLVFFGSWCYLATSFTPALYSMQNPGPERLLNTYYFTFLCLLVLNMFYLLGWLAKRADLFTTENNLSLNDAIFIFMRKNAIYFLCFVSFLFLSLSVMLGTHTLTSYHAVRSLMAGEAASYAQQQNERMAIYEDDTVQVAVLEPLQTKPYLLYFNDVTTNPDEWINTVVAGYYEKEAVYEQVP